MCIRDRVIFLSATKVGWGQLAQLRPVVGVHVNSTTLPVVVVGIVMTVPAFTVMSGPRLTVGISPTVTFINPVSDGQTLLLSPITR